MRVSKSVQGVRRTHHFLLPLLIRYDYVILVRDDLIQILETTHRSCGPLVLLILLTLKELIDKYVAAATDHASRPSRLHVHIDCVVDATGPNRINVAAIHHLAFGDYGCAVRVEDGGRAHGYTVLQIVVEGCLT